MSMERDLSQPMTPARFAALAEAYGGDLHNWPEADREAARQFQQTDPEFARPVLTEAASLDALLETGQVTFDPMLYETIMGTGLRQTSHPPRWAGLAAAAALLFGAGAGWFSVEPSSGTDDAVYFADAFSVLVDDEASLFEETS